MKLLFVGKTDFQYNRTLVLLAGLEKMPGIEVERITILKRDRITKRKINNKSKDADFVIVPPFRHRDLGFIKSASQAPVVFDPLISRYLTRVIDYGIKWKGLQKYIIDWFDFRRADIMIWDTMSHHNWLKDKFRFNQPNAPIYIGVDTSRFYYIAHNNAQASKLKVGFYGSYNPLQGIDIIIKAAHILRNEENIEFELIGFGATYKSMRKLADNLKIKNITFSTKVAYDDLNAAINKFDICLGVFGQSIKTDLVIPNKIYHYAAAMKPIITKDTAAVREIFAGDALDIYTIDNSPKALASTILSLSKDLSKQLEMGRNAYNLITYNYNQDKVAESFVNFLRTCRKKID